MKPREPIDTRKPLDPSIYEHDGKTIVAFGCGSIQIGVATDSHGQVMIYLADVLRKNPIGLDLAPWESANKGRTVILGFNRVDSLRVLQRSIEDAIAKFEPEPPNDPA